MIMLRDDGDDDFNDTRDQEQECLHINDFVRVNSLLKKFFIVYVFKFERPWILLFFKHVSIYL